MAFYGRIREGRAAHQVSIGTGVNAYPRHPAVYDYVHAAVDSILVRGRSSRYSEPVGDLDERVVLADLLNIYAEREVFDADDVIATNGSTEAIGLVFMACGETHDCDAVLPLPAYFAYELSAARWDLPVRAHYDPGSGQQYDRGPTGRDRSVVVVNSPESVTGTALSRSGHAALTALARDDDLIIYDCIYQLEDLEPHDGTSLSSREIVRAAVDDRLDRTVLLFTASKDLSVPGLRAGMLVTKSAALRDAVSRLLMERYYAPPPLPAYLMGLYLCVLNASTGHDSSARLKALFDTDALAIASGRRAIETLSDPMTIREHRRRMIEHFERGYAIARQRLHDRALGDLVTLGTRPTAGYSTTLEIGPLRASPTAMFELSRRWLDDHDLRVYPHLVFGGDAEGWESLHPGRSFIRLNVSGPADELVDRLDRVGAGIKTTV